MRVSIRVRPGAGRTRVGGDYDGALVVAVSARAVDGRATEAALRALAEAAGVPRRSVTLVTGATSRTKVVEIAADEGVEVTVGRRIAELRDGGASGRSR